MLLEFEITLCHVALALYALKLSIVVMDPNGLIILDKAMLTL